MSIRDSLVAQFRAAQSAPFLFVGSGFSRRYINLEDWEGLLKRFSDHLPHSFDYYRSTANSSLAEVARLMAIDFHDIWWRSAAFAENREKFQSSAKDKTSALRIEICQYLRTISLEAAAPAYQKEIDLLSRLNVDGIITTNWDFLLEGLFPDFKVYVGQSELLFSNPQSIGEIYKIHGSAGRPSSLVLTSEDYDDFHRLNPYLAAKLITLFVEHPMVFVGYSLTDTNIAALLEAIVGVLGPENLPKLQDNLIFIKRASGSPPSYAKTVMAIGRIQLPITVVTTDDFCEVYEALDQIKRKIPARVLRHCKEQLYELVKKTEPGGKLVVVDIDEIDSKDDVEFLVGVGVATEAAAERAAQIGYQGIGANELYDDLIGTDDKFDPNLILTMTVPDVGKRTKYLPIFKHLRRLGICNREDLKKTKFDLARHIPKDESFYQGGAEYNKAFLRAMKGMSAADIIAAFPPEKAATYLPFLVGDAFDKDAVFAFLKKHVERLHGGQSYSTFYRKLACRWDYEVNGQGFAEN